MKQILPLIAILYLQTSCSDNSQINNHDDPVTINVNISQLENDSLNISVIADRIEYIPLQTSDSVLIADVYDFSVVQDNYFIYSGQLVYRFDQNGKYLNKVFNPGKGPEEIIPRCFAVNEQDSSVYVYGINESINIYSYSGDYRGTISNPFEKVKSSPNYTIGFFNKYLFIPISQRPSVEYIYSCYDFQNDSLIVLSNNYRRYNPSQMDQWPTLIPPDHRFQIKDSYLLYKENFSDTIFSVDTSFNKQVKYIVNLGANKLEWETWRDTRMFIISDNPPGGYGVQSFIETQSHVILTLSSFKDPGLLAVFNKENHSTTVYPCNGDKNPHTQHMQQVYLRNDLDGVIPIPFTTRAFFNCYEDCLYIVINAIDFAEAYASSSEHTKKSSEYLRKMYPFFSTITENSNPIIAKVYLK